MKFDQHGFEEDIGKLFVGLAVQQGLTYDYKNPPGDTMVLHLPRQNKLSFGITLTLQDDNELCIYAPKLWATYFPGPDKAVQKNC
jgi:hypothetical protein